MIELTPKQLKEIDEIHLDKAAADSTLNIALTYHSNRLNTIRKQEKDWWEDLMEIYNLDRNKTWMIDKSASIIHIREKTEDD